MELNHNIQKIMNNFWQSLLFLLGSKGDDQIQKEEENNTPREERYIQICPKCGNFFSHKPQEISQEDDCVECPNCHDKVYARDVRTLCEKIGCHHCPDNLQIPCETAEKEFIEKILAAEEHPVCENKECPNHMSNHFCPLMRKIGDRCCEKVCEGL